MADPYKAFEVLTLCGCFRCGKRLVYEDHRLPCVVDAPMGIPTAVFCPPCYDITEAGRVGEEAALAGRPMSAFHFETIAEWNEFAAEYQRTSKILKATKPPSQE